MKKIFIMCMTLMLSLGITNAQVAYERAKLFDNVYGTVQGGVSTPLSFNQMCPLNAKAGIAVGKWFTPVWGAEVEGTAWFGSHTHGYVWGTEYAQHFDYANVPVDDAHVIGGDTRVIGHNAIRGHYVGVNSRVNLSNLIWGYKGTPRKFELGTLVGLGWLHIYRHGISDKSENYLGLRTGVDIAYNFGTTKAHSVSLRPSVMWDLCTYGTMPLQFDKRYAQLSLDVAYTYHFKTSNGTRHFKTYDVGAMMAEINMLRAELDKKPKEVIKENVVEKVVEKVVVEEHPITVERTHVVTFAKNDATLSNASKSELNKVSGVVNVYGYASPEGNEEYNYQLSRERANVVANYLRNRGVKVGSVVGYGAADNTSNRIVIVEVQ